jgi:hypothetical protein
MNVNSKQRYLSTLNLGLEKIFGLTLRKAERYVYAAIVLRSYPIRGYYHKEQHLHSGKQGEMMDGHKSVAILIYIACTYRCYIQLLFT